MLRRSRWVFLWVACCSLGCSADRPQPKEITLATTTSTQDSGLLDVLLPAFERKSGVKVKVVAVGSGQALELGRRGDADVLLSHAPEAEQRFMDQGWGGKRLAFMHNDFVLVGPANDPAEISTARTAAQALKSIAHARDYFVSRDDESGTHQMERKLWEVAGVDPQGEWYLRAGSGMAQTLRLANERKAYVLCDRATYLALRHEGELIVLFEGDERLVNRYAVITVNAEKHSHVRRAEASRFADFLVSPEGQNIIGAFGNEKYGQPLFFPNGRLEDSEARDSRN